MSEISKFLYSGNVDDAFKGIIVVLLSFCLAQQAQAGSISISNRNCAWQGRHKTNQAKFHLWAFVRDPEDKPPNVTFAKDCTTDWLTLHVGTTQTIQVAEWVRYVGKVGQQCHYIVEAEGVFGSGAEVWGKDISRYVCELDWANICQCKTQ
jgi:hypothetical protein